MTPEREKLIRETWERVRRGAFRDGDPVCFAPIRERMLTTDAFHAVDVTATEAVEYLRFDLVPRSLRTPDGGRISAVICEGIILEHVVVPRR